MNEWLAYVPICLFCLLQWCIIVHCTKPSKTQWGKSSKFSLIFDTVYQYIRGLPINRSKPKFFNNRLRLRPPNLLDKIFGLSRSFFWKIQLIFDIKNWLWKYNFGTFWWTIIHRQILWKKIPFSMLILGQTSWFLGPTIFKIPQLNWH